jgi:uncharacterized membrane protein YbaN (DUF454 family)
MKPMSRSRVAATVRIALGVFFVLLGVAGVFLPILQGLIFLALGAVLLAPHVPFFDRMRAWIYHRFPATEIFVERCHRRFHRHRRK